MTVEELIDRLEDMPADRQVVVGGSGVAGVRLTPGEVVLLTEQEWKERRQLPFGQWEGRSQIP